MERDTVTEEQTEGIKLQLEMLIFGRTSQVCYNPSTGELADRDIFKTRLGDIAIFDSRGGKNLSRTLDKPMYEVIQTKRGGTTDFQRGREYGLWEKLAKQLSVVFAVSIKDAENLILPYLKLGSAKLILATLHNSMGLSNDLSPEIAKLFGITENKWMVFGDIPSAQPNLNGSFNVINQVLRENKLTNWQIRTPELTSGTYQQKELDRLTKMVEALQKQIQNK